MRRTLGECPLCYQKYICNGDLYSIRDLMKLTNLSKPGVMGRINAGVSIATLLEEGRIKKEHKLHMRDLTEGSLTPSGAFLVLKVAVKKTRHAVLHLVQCTTCGRRHTLDSRSLSRSRKGCITCAHGFHAQVAGEPLSLRELCELFSVWRCRLHGVKDKLSTILAIRRQEHATFKPCKS
jgi:hypothetical protein